MTYLNYKSILVDTNKSQSERPTFLGSLFVQKLSFLQIVLNATFAPFIVNRFSRTDAKHTYFANAENTASATGFWCLFWHKSFYVTCFH